MDLNDQWTDHADDHRAAPEKQGDFTYDPHFGDLNVADYYRPYNKDDWYQTALTVEGKISNWDINYTGGYFWRQVDNLVDYSQYSIAYDAQAIANAYAYTRFVDANGHLLDRPVQYTQNADKYEKQSHEFRVTSPADYRLKGTAGVFYQRQSDNIRAGFDMPNLPVFYEVAGQQDVYYLSQMTRTDRDYAAFSELSFDITDQFKVIGGIREFWVNNTLDGFFGFNDNGYSTHSGEALCLPQGNPIVTTPGVYTGGLQPCNNTNKKVVEHGETHKVSLQYQITPSHMAYFTWSTGFRPGGNNRLPTASAYGADTLTNFELGWKTDWFEHRLRANGAVFYEKWFNVQTAVQGQYGITSIVNAGNARVEGIESALEWAATEHLDRVRCGYGPLAHGDYVGFLRAHNTGGGAEHVHACPRRCLSGHAIAGNAQGEDERHRPICVRCRHLTRVMCRGVVNHQSSTTYSLESTRFYAGDTPSFTTFDLSAGTGMDNWHLEGYIDNLFNKQRRARQEFGMQRPRLHYCLLNAHVYPVRPMQFGVKFGQKF